MALYTGVTGKITIKKKTETGEAVDLLHMGNWKVNISKEIIEAVSFGQDYKEKVPSVKDWSATADGSADFDSDSNQKALIDAFEEGTLLTGSFYLTEGVFFQGDCLVESLDIEDAADGKANISISLAGSKAVGFTVPTT